MKKITSHFQVLVVLAILVTAFAGGTNYEKVFGSDLSEKYSCNGDLLSPTELAEYRGISLGIAQKLHSYGFLRFSNLCSASQAELDQAIANLENAGKTSKISADAYANVLVSLEELLAQQGLSAASAGIDNTSWNWIGPGNIGGRVQALAVHPTNKDIMWAGGISGGVWKTINGGESWQIQDDFMTSMTVTAIVVNPKYPDVLYAGTGEKVGDIHSRWIFRTTDGGSTWTQLDRTSGNPTDTFYIHDLAISSSANNGNTLLVATEDGILRCTEAYSGGNKCQDVGDWSIVHTDSGNDVLDIEFSLTDPLRAVAGVEGGVTLYSDDGGSTWNPVTLEGEAGMGSVEVAYGAGSVVYASATITDVEESIDGAYIYTSGDDGENFSSRIGSAMRTYLGVSGADANTLWVDPDVSTNVVVGGIDLYRSTDGGVTIDQISNSTQVPNFVHIAISGSDNQIIIGTDGGIYRADDINTVTTTSGWTELNNNLGITEFSCIYVDASGNITGNTRSTGTVYHASGDGTEAWTKVADVDCSETINPYSVNTTGLTDVTRVVKEGSTHYATTGGYNIDNVWKTTDDGNTWTQVGTLPLLMPVYDLAISPLNSNHLYIGTEFGVFATENANAGVGATWSLSSDADGPTGSSVRDLDLVGSTLYAATYGRGVFTVEIGASVDPAHDDFDAAKDISTNLNNAINGSSMPHTVEAGLDTTNATQAGDDPAVADCDIAPGPATVWYEYTPSESVGEVNLAIDTKGSDYDTYLAVWTGDRGNLTPLACNNDISSTDEDSQIGITLTDDTAYFIEAGEYNGELSGASVGGDLVLTISSVVGTVTGTVRDGSDAPIEGATVRAAGQSDTTDAAGEYLLFPVPADANEDDDLTVTASKAGLPSASQLVDVEDGATTADVDFVLSNPVDPVDPDVTVTIGGTPKGIYPMLTGESQVLRYPVDGAVEISSSNGANIIASLNQFRRLNNTGPYTGVAQSMALPDDNISNIYVMPRYDYSNPAQLYDAVLLANVDTVSRDITVTIGGTEMGTYTLGPSGSVFKLYPGVADGPLVVSSDAGAKIIASLYELRREKSGVGWNGQSEMMGLPSSQLSDKYLIPIYFGDPSYLTLDAQVFIAVPSTP
ncbi:MAG: hypothetical protein HN929_10900 [Chloroflexi bacterium]|jgi:hypothetical protein|nr:hypothetical protein [Chloroflexota bacterium]